MSLIVLGTQVADAVLANLFKTRGNRLKRRAHGAAAAVVIALTVVSGCGLTAVGRPGQTAPATRPAPTAQLTVARSTTATSSADSPPEGSDDIETPKLGTRSAPPNPTPTAYPTRSGAPPTDQAVTIAAAGDIACDPKNAHFHGGLGDPVGCQQKATSDLLLAMHPTAVLALGDIQYEHGTTKNYQESYIPTWGRFKDITYPAIGNHEGGQGGSNKSYFQYFGARAGDPTKGYYSFNLGAWHIVSLNTNCGTYDFNDSHDQCAKGSAQDEWLRHDLAANPTKCTMAIFHVPRFASGGGHYSNAVIATTDTALWDDLYAGGVDVVLNGHSHSYERFLPLTPAGQVDQAHGVREFVVGTGGDEHRPFQKPTIIGSQYQNNTSYGVLKMGLESDSYTWQFVSTPGGTNHDHGSADCH